MNETRIGKTVVNLKYSLVEKKLKENSFIMIIYFTTSNIYQMEIFISISCRGRKAKLNKKEHFWVTENPNFVNSVRKY